MTYIIIAVVVVLLGIYVMITYNKLAKLKIRVEEGFSTMDVYLKKRWDLIPNLVDIVKGYMKHEGELLKELTKIRKTSYETLSFEEKANTSGKLSDDISKIFAIAEDYPELKASENFINLSEEITKVEEEIANARKYYNGTVRNINVKIVTFPSMLVALIFGYKKEKMFEATTEERNDVEISL